MSETPNYWTLLVNKLSRAARSKVTFGTSFRRSAVLPLVKLPRILKNFPGRPTPRATEQMLIKPFQLARVESSPSRHVGTDPLSAEQESIPRCWTGDGGKASTESDQMLEGRA